MQDFQIPSVVKFLRGKRSQNQINLKMGYSSNQVARWESGHSNISWSEFQRFCVVTKVPLQTILQYFFKGQEEKMSSSSLLSALAGQRSLKELASDTGLSYGKLRKWQIHSYEATVEEVFQVIKTLNYSLLLEFLNKLKILFMYKELNQDYDKLLEWKKAYYQNPRLQLALHAFSLKEYDKLKIHRAGYLAKLLNMGLKEEKEIIHLLESLGIIEFSTNSKKYVILKFPLTSFGNTPEALKIREYWFNEGIKKLQMKKSKQTEDIFGSLVLLLTSKQKKLLASRILELVDEFRQCDDLENADQIQVFNVQLFSPVCEAQ